MKHLIFLFFLIVTVDSFAQFGSGGVAQFVSGCCNEPDSTLLENCRTTRGEIFADWTLVIMDNATGIYRVFDAGTSDSLLCPSGIAFGDKVCSSVNKQNSTTLPLANGNYYATPAGYATTSMYTAIIPVFRVEDDEIFILEMDCRSISCSGSGGSTGGTGGAPDGVVTNVENTVTGGLGFSGVNGGFDNDVELISTDANNIIEVGSDNRLLAIPCKPSIVNFNIIGDAAGFSVSFVGSTESDGTTITAATGTTWMKISYDGSWIETFQPSATAITAVSWQGSDGNSYTFGGNATDILNFIDLDVSAVTGDLFSFSGLTKGRNNQLEETVTFEGYVINATDISSFCTQSEMMGVETLKEVWTGRPRNLDFCSPVGIVSADFNNGEVTVIDKNTHLVGQVITSFTNPWATIYDKYTGNYYLTADRKIFTTTAINGNTLGAWTAIQTTGGVDLELATASHFITNISIDPLIEENGKPVFWVGVGSSPPSVDEVFVVVWNGTEWIATVFYDGGGNPYIAADKYTIERLPNGDMVIGTSIGALYGHYDGGGAYNQSASYQFVALSGTGQNTHGTIVYQNSAGNLDALTLLLNENTIRRTVVNPATNTISIQNQLIAGANSIAAVVDGGVGISRLHSPVGIADYKNGLWYFASLNNGGIIRTIDTNTFDVQSITIYKEIF